jgi:crotonobetainyl-CoA:carnitine CoA-transferase CaiB-like acyl-CoA transferase
MHTIPAAESGVGKDVRVPLAPFRFAHGGPAVRSAPKRVGADTDAVLGELGYSAADIARLREQSVV